MRKKLGVFILLLGEIILLNGCSSTTDVDINAYKYIAEDCLTYSLGGEISSNINGLDTIEPQVCDTFALAGCQCLEIVHPEDKPFTSLCTVHFSYPDFDYTILSRVTFNYDLETNTVSDVEVKRYGSIH